MHTRTVVRVPHQPVVARSRSSTGRKEWPQKAKNVQPSTVEKVTSSARHNHSEQCFVYTVDVTTAPRAIMLYNYSQLQCMGSETPSKHVGSQTILFPPPSYMISASSWSSERPVQGVQSNSIASPSSSSSSITLVEGDRVPLTTGAGVGDGITTGVPTLTGGSVRFGIGAGVSPVSGQGVHVEQSPQPRQICPRPKSKEARIVEWHRHFGGGRWHGIKPGRGSVLVCFCGDITEGWQLC